VDAFVADWLTPLVAVFFRSTGDFAEASFEVHGSVFKYG
jgi:large-conductance mechanosensitive channel